jgi:regulatory protein
MRLELPAQLKAHAEPDDDVEALLDELAAKGWLSDARFAEQSIRAGARRFGPVKLRHTLRAKGVDEDAIASAFRAAGADGRANIESVWARRFHAPPVGNREKARHARFLQGRGFASEEIFRFLAQLREPA